MEKKEFTINEQNGQVTFYGDWINWYDSETEGLLETSPLIYEDAEILDIDKERIVFETNNYSKLSLNDQVIFEGKNLKY